MAQEHRVIELRADRTELINPAGLKPSQRASSPPPPEMPAGKIKPFVTKTEIRGVAELVRAPSMLVPIQTQAHLRSDLSVMVQMESLRRDPAWRLEKLGQQTKDVTWRSFDTGVELLRDGIEKTLTALLIGSRRLSDAVSKAVADAWRTSKAMGRGNAAAFEPEIRIGRLSTLARAAELRSRADASGTIIAKLSMGTQVFVMENYSAPEGYVLVQTTEGDIGFLAR